jgi:hypothetical protein
VEPHGTPRKPKHKRVFLSSSSFFRNGRRGKVGFNCAKHQPPAAATEAP